MSIGIAVPSDIIYTSGDILHMKVIGAVNPKLLFWTLDMHYF